MGIPVPFELPEDQRDACTMLDDGCPVVSGTSRNVKKTMTVSAPMSGVSPWIRLSVTNENNEELMCVEFQIEIVS